MHPIHTFGEAVFGWMEDPDQNTRTSEGEAQ
jgi:hypothetical protein